MRRLLLMCVVCLLAVAAPARAADHDADRVVLQPADVPFAKSLGVARGTALRELRLLAGKRTSPETLDAVRYEQGAVRVTVTGYRLRAARDVRSLRARWVKRERRANRQPAPLPGGLAQMTVTPTEVRAIVARGKAVASVYVTGSGEDVGELGQGFVEAQAERLRMVASFDAYDAVFAQARRDGRLPGRAVVELASLVLRKGGPKPPRGAVGALFRAYSEARLSRGQKAKLARLAESRASKRGRRGRTAQRRVRCAEGVNRYRLDDALTRTARTEVDALWERLQAHAPGVQPSRPPCVYVSQDGAPIDARGSDGFSLPWDSAEPFDAPRFLEPGRGRADTCAVVLSGEEVEQTLVHELFHCHAWMTRSLSLWFEDSSAEWTAVQVKGPASGTSEMFEEYLDNNLSLEAMNTAPSPESDEVSLRQYAGIGVLGAVEEAAGADAVWTAIARKLRGEQGDELTLLTEGPAREAALGHIARGWFQRGDWPAGWAQAKPLSLGSSASLNARGVTDGYLSAGHSATLDVPWDHPRRMSVRVTNRRVPKILKVRFDGVTGSATDGLLDMPLGPGGELYVCMTQEASCEECPAGQVPIDEIPPYPNVTDKLYIGAAAVGGGGGSIGFEAFRRKCGPCPPSTLCVVIVGSRFGFVDMLGSRGPRADACQLLQSNPELCGGGGGPLCPPTCRKPSGSLYEGREGATLVNTQVIAFPHPGGRFLRWENCLSDPAAHSTFPLCSPPGTEGRVVRAIFGPG